MDLRKLTACVGFDWDEGNYEKNWRKHRVSASECEQLFFNRPLVVADDLNHSQEGSCWYALGRTDSGRRLFLVFTIRGERIRVISVRDMSRAEKRIYDEKKDPQV